MLAPDNKQFTIKYRYLNTPGMQLTTGKMMHFDKFKGKQAQTVGKLFMCLQGLAKKMFEDIKVEAETLGGKENQQGWSFEDEDNGKKFDTWFENLMDSSAAVECKKLSYDNLLFPHEKELKLTPQDWVVLQPFIEGYPVI